MPSITSIIGYPLGLLMRFIYNIIPNYGIALLIFTVITRVILIPVSVKQQKSSARLSVIQPEVKALQEKYKNNREKQSEELAALYARENYSPTSGCLPMVLQMGLLFGLIDVVYKPLTYILNLSKEVIAHGTSIFALIGNLASTTNMAELEFTKALIEKPALFSSLGESAIATIRSLDYTFLGLDLMIRPSMDMITGIFSGKFNIVIIIPILSAVTAFISSMVSMKGMASNPDDPTASSMKSMMYVMPIMSFFVAFSVPAGVGLYWVYANVFAIVQTKFINKFYSPEKMREEAAKEAEVRREQEKVKRQEEKEKLQELGKLDEKYEGKSLSKKDIANIKLSEARKRDEEKYGIE